MYEKNYQNRPQRNDRNERDTNSYNSSSGSYRQNEDGDHDQTTGGNWGQTQYRQNRFQNSQNSSENDFQRSENDFRNGSQNRFNDNRYQNDQQEGRFSQSNRFNPNERSWGSDNELERNERSASDYGRQAPRQDWNKGNSRYGYDRQNEQNWNLDNGRFQGGQSRTIGRFDDEDRHIRGQRLGQRDQGNHRNHEDDFDTENKEFSPERNRSRSNEWRHNY